MTRIVLGTLLLLYSGAAALASDASWLIGGGAVVSFKPYTDIDSKTTPVPLIGRTGGEESRFYFEGASAGVRLVEVLDFSVDAIASLRLMGYDSSDSPALAGMQDRDWSVDAGIRLTHYGPLEFRVQGLADILDKSGGYELSAGAFIPIDVPRWRIRPGVEALWQSDALVDYYYGVAPNEATPARPAFEGQSALSWRISLQSRFEFTPDWFLQTNLNVDLLNNDIQDSPIVSDNTSTSVLIGVIHRFQ